MVVVGIAMTLLIGLVFSTVGLLALRTERRRAAGACSPRAWSSAMSGGVTAQPGQPPARLPGDRDPDP